MIALWLVACAGSTSDAGGPADQVDEGAGSDGSAASGEPRGGSASGPSSKEGVLTEVFAPPKGAERLPTDAFGTWLRARTVKPAGVGVKTHAGRRVAHDARVVDLPMVRGDLQQCADSVMRLRAEWQKETGQPVMFHATSGDPMPWSRWAAGERPVEKGGRLQWVPGTDGGWDTYLGRVFNWAGTLSLHAYDSVPADGDPKVGDLLVKPGSPGHAVILLDVAARGDERFVLVGEGFMPAQDFHVELGPEAGWWRWEPGVDLGHWDLSVDPADPGEVHRRFKR